MKTCILFIFIFYSISTQAANYYFSSESGDDRRTILQAQQPGTPWKTLTKLNAFFAHLRPGDTVLFKRNETFYGKIVVSKSGSFNKSIIISAYGLGKKPIISGLTSVISWRNVGKNIWESVSALATGSKCNMVVIDGVNSAMGRYPNTGYLTYEAHDGDKSITSSSLTGSRNWTGAEIVIRKNHYIIDRSKVVAQSGGTLFHNATSHYEAENGYGFFFQDDIRTLDTLNEWYYNHSTKKIRIFKYRQPTNVQVSTIDTLVYIKEKQYLTFDGIEFKGSNTNTFYSYLSSNIIIQNCRFDFSGINAVSAYLSSNIKVVRSTFNNTNNNAITITSWDYTPLPTHDVLVSEDTIRNTAVLAGMGRMVDDQSERCAIFLVGSNNIIQKCLIDSTGYIPIWWAGDSFLIKNNLITNFCFVKDDGGAIWTWNNGTHPIVFTNQRIIDNIILNGIGALTGSVPDIFSSASGIYVDCNASNIEVTGNTIANCNRSGILIHNAHEIAVRKNTLFNNHFQITLFSDDYFTNDIDSVSLVRNIVIKDNISFARTAVQQCLAVVSYRSDIGLFGIIDSNYYARPINDDLTIEVVSTVPAWKEMLYSLSDWHSYSGFDAHSGTSPRGITNINVLKFEYNATASNKTVSLDADYIDVKGTLFQKSIKLTPFSSAVLIKSNAATNPPPGDKASSRGFGRNMIPLQSGNYKNKVYQNFPNPFSSTTTMKYETGSKGLVKIIIYDIFNRQMAVLVNEIKESGTYEVQWNAENIALGNYFYSVIAGDSVMTKKMLKVK